MGHPGKVKGRTREAFLQACEGAEVAAEHRDKLWEVARRFAGDAEEGERRAIEDYGHYRLFRQSLDGDEAASARFARTWRGYLKSYLGSRFPPDRIDEVTSIFFERVYRGAGRVFRWECPFSTYLRRVALNLARTQATRGAAQRRREVSLDDDEAGYHEVLPGDAPTPEERLLLEERQARLRDALAELDPADLQILRRCLLDGESGEEVAASLGIRRDALYQRINRARQRARKLLAGKGLLSDLGPTRVKQA